MVSRLVLVGAVAVLGATLPGRSGGDGWFTSARVWMIARLADWDACRSRGDGEGIVVTPSESWEQEVVPVATPAPAPANFDPIPVAQDLDCGIADELNRVSDGVTIPPRAILIAETRPDFASAPSIDSIETRLALEVCRFVENRRVVENLAPLAVDQPRQAQDVDSIGALFGTDMAMFAPSADTPTSDIPAESPPNPARVEIDSYEPLVDCKSGIDGERARSAERIEPEPGPEVVGRRPARVWTFALIEVPADLESGTAYELNHASEGLGIVPADPRRLGNTPPPGRGREHAAHAEAKADEDKSLGKAIRLTRDAASAWMDLFSGPTPVEMTSR